MINHTRFKYHDYYITIGLEIHVALQTKKKLFSSTDNAFSVEDIALLDCAIPGALPVLNHEAVEMACIFGLATNSKINQYSEFERKHYFYPDLALGYQITQQHKPILGTGFIPIEINGYKKFIEIEHSHLECDAAKSLHDMYSTFTAIDISRGGTALIEIVSTPCIHTPLEAVTYAKTIHSLVSTLDICDGKMEEGSFRVDASISLSKDMNKLGTRVEIKNISSFHFLELALNYEIERQFSLLNSGESVLMQTRLYHEDSNTTIAMRDKETVQDYRYMQDPDIPALCIDSEYLDKVYKSYFVDYFGILEFYQNTFKEHKINIDNDKILDLLKSDLKSYLIYIYKNSQILSTFDVDKLFKSIFYWIPEVQTKIKETPFILIEIEDFLNIINTPIQSKEFKDGYSEWLKSPTKPFKEFFIKKEGDIEILVSFIKATCNKYQEQLNDVKLTIDKKIQFIMGQTMKEFKGQFTAQTISQEVKKLFQ